MALSLKQTNEIKVDLDKDENNVKDIAKNPATNIEEEDEKMQEEHESMKISENETIAKSQTKAEIALEHLDNKNFVVHPPIEKCHHCGKNFTLKNNLKVHIKQVHEELSHCKCVCGKSFKFKRNMRKHFKENKCSEKGAESDKEPKKRLLSRDDKFVPSKRKKELNLEARWSNGPNKMMWQRRRSG